MKQTTAPGKTPSPQLKSAKSSNEVGKTRSQGRIFMAAVLDMSWQMAIVVVVPIVGGFKLDSLWHTTPALTIIGFLVAMAGTFAIMRNMVAKADQRFTPKEQR